MTDRSEEAREQLAEQLASIEERPVDEHPEVFADVNEAIVAELSAMEDV